MADSNSNKLEVLRAKFKERVHKSANEIKEKCGVEAANRYLANMTNIMRASRLYHEAQFKAGNMVSCVNKCGDRWVNDSSLQAKQGGHYCSVRDKEKAGCYHWFTINNGKICTIYFGYGQDLVESLRFLSLPAKYAIGTSTTNDLEEEHPLHPNKSQQPSTATLTSKYMGQCIRKINQAFAENNYIYLNYLSLDAVNGLGSSGHAVKVCSEYSNSSNEFNRKYYLNKIHSDNHSDYIKYPYNIFEHYMNKTRKDLKDDKRHIKFNLDQFQKLINEIKDNNTFKLKLGNLETNLHNNPNHRTTLIEINFIEGTVTNKYSHYKNENGFNLLVNYLKSINPSFNLPNNL